MRERELKPYFSMNLSTSLWELELSSLHSRLKNFQDVWLYTTNLFSSMQMPCQV